MTPDTRRSDRAPSGDRPSDGASPGPLARGTRRQFVRSVGAGALALGATTGATAGATAGATTATAQSASRPFVGTDGTDLVVDGESIYFHGANNFWITDAYRGTRERIDSLFDQFAEMGIDLVRTFVACEGGDGACYIREPYTHSEAAYESLDYLIDAAGRRDIRLVLVLADNWDHNGGAAQYVDWIDGASVHADFFDHPDCRELYRWHVEETLTRENTVNGLRYSQDPTIAFWELCNEPRVEGDAFGEGEDPGYEPRAALLEDWLTEMAGFVSDLAPDQLVSTGTEGFYTREDRTEWFYGEWTGQDFLRHHAIDDVDVATFHWYPYHWNVPLEYGTTWIEEHVRDAHEELGKPAYMGEFNVNRDSGLEARNRFLAEWYEAADAFDCDAATIWQVVLPEMHDHDGFQVYRSESGDVLGEYRDALEVKNGVAPADGTVAHVPPTSVVTTSTGSSVSAFWASTARATEYALSLDGSPAGTTAATSARFTDLDPEAEHEVGVAAIDSTGAETDLATTTATTVGPETVDAPAWTDGDVYEDGDGAVHNGIVWTAQWYTDAEEPRFESGYAWTFDRVVASPVGPAEGEGGDATDPCVEVGGAQSATVDGQTVCDLDGDELYMDVTGDGDVNHQDVVHFFQHQHAQAWKHPEYFDFSGSDDVGHGDVVELFQHVATGGL